ncbi:MAG: YggS family pyridoxal phosphate-dependent enzyme [Synechococcus sp.]
MASARDDRRQRWRALRSQIPAGVRLLAVSKGHPAASVRHLAEMGQIDFGESRLQDALPKQEQLADLSSIRWHFIGRLQTNKVRPVVRAFAVIHSVDSLPLAERMNRIAGEEGLTPEAFLQVKLRPDPTKGGWEPSGLIDAWQQLQALPHLRFTGLMTMAPMDCSDDQRRALFADCRSLADRLELPECSMGMSGDWQEAVAAGATWVRVGSGLFGARPGPAISPGRAMSSG